MTQTETKWLERVREWRGSGETAERFAEGQGFKASTLRFWASRLRTEADAAFAPGMPPAATSRVRLVRVRRARGAAPKPLEPRGAWSASEGTSSAAMVIAIGAVRVEVRSGFDHALLGEVIEALGGAR
jgi:hypothetical protein